MLKVVLVEDESVIREGIKNTVPWKEYGYEFAGEAADGEMALSVIRKTQPDVLITDIKMPFMDGLSLSKIVSEEFPKMKIIIISGYDDFEYARQAIAVGVSQYLLKPITKSKIKNVLLEIKEKLEQELKQQDYQQQFQNEMLEYERFERRRFFEKLLEGELAVKDIYEEASKLSLDLNASCYNLLLLYIQENGTDISEEQENIFLRKQDEIIHYFMRNPSYILFRCNVNCYGVLIKSEPEQMKIYMDESVERIKTRFLENEKDIKWYVALGEPVERLSMLPKCYQSVNHYFAYRFIMPNQHILTQETLKNYLAIPEETDFANVDSTTMDPEIIRDFLVRGTTEKIHDFVELYLQNIRTALESQLFRGYVVLNIRFTIIAYIESLGVKKEEYQELLEKLSLDMHLKSNEVDAYFEDMLQTAMTIREKENEYFSGKVLRKALEYIDQNFDHEDISLNSVARQVDVTANYLSAIFSQNVQKTFVEYVTAKRIEKAKKLLRYGDKSSGEIAAEIGYKDPHYFSFVFKKTQGCSPREYRAAKKK